MLSAYAGGVSVAPENIELVHPRAGSGSGVMILAGSSGAMEHDRAQLLADHGAVALAMRWFGGRGQQSGPWEVPFETFTAALDLLAPEVDRLAILGSSFGAEAALLVAARDDRIKAVVALSPSAYVWPGADETGRMRSHRTLDGARHSGRTD